MVTVTDVLSLLKAFEDVKKSEALSLGDKKLIARELLASVPAEIVAPQCKHASEAVRGILYDYLGVTRTKTAEAKSESASSEDTSSAARAEETGKPSTDTVVERPRVASEAHSAPKKPAKGQGKTNRSA